MVALGESETTHEQTNGLLHYEPRVCDSFDLYKTLFGWVTRCVELGEWCPRKICNKTRLATAIPPGGCTCGGTGLGCAPPPRSAFHTRSVCAQNPLHRFAVGARGMRRRSLAAFFLICFATLLFSLCLCRRALVSTQGFPGLRGAFSKAYLCCFSCRAAASERTPA